MLPPGIKELKAYVVFHNTYDKPPQKKNSLAHVVIW